MNARALAILLAVFALCGLALFLTRQGGEIGPSGGPGHKSAAQLIDRALLDERVLGTTLDAIGLYPHGQGRAAKTSIAMQLHRGRWEVFAPHPFPADTQALDELLNLLGGLQGRISQTQHPSKPQAPPGTHASLSGGIHSDPPALRLRQAGGGWTTLTLGQRLGGGRAILYVQTPDGEGAAYNAEDTLHDLMANLDPGVCYARQIAPPLMPEVGRIEITTPQGSGVLTQQDGRWRIGTGRQAERAMAQTLDGQPGLAGYFALFSSIELGPNQAYAGEQGLTKFGLDKPLITVRFAPLDRAQASDWTLRIGTPADPGDQARYLAWGPTDENRPAVFTCPTPIALAFAQDVNRFRDPRITTLSPALIGNVGLPEVEGQPASLALHRDTPRYMLGTVSTALSTQRVNAMLEALTTARAIDFVVSEPPQTEPLSRLTLNSRLGGEAEALTVFADPESTNEQPTVLIRRGDECVYLRVQRGVVSALLDTNTLQRDPLDAP